MIGKGTILILLMGRGKKRDFGEEGLATSGCGVRDWLRWRGEGAGQEV
jgi:hypothetical protein